MNLSSVGGRHAIWQFSNGYYVGVYSTHEKLLDPKNPLIMPNQGVKNNRNDKLVRHLLRPQTQQRIDGMYFHWEIKYGEDEREDI